MQKKLIVLGLFVSLCLGLGIQEPAVHAKTTTKTMVKTVHKTVKEASATAVPVASPAETSVSLDLSPYYEGADGCFMLYDEKENRNYIYNELKSKKQVPPCSTFKIFNSLVFLDTRVVPDATTITKWDGKHYDVSAWNQDQSLNSAIINSAVWYFQKNVVKVGSKRMTSYLKKMNYGNKDISAGIDRFWLQSSLKISPCEQLEFLKRFYTYQLPFKKQHIDIVKKALLLKSTPELKLYGKTGSGMSEGKYVNGWFVGYVEKDGNAFIFVNNMEGSGISGMDAKNVALKVLADKFGFVTN